jgi:arylsulfatase
MSENVFINVKKRSHSITAEVQVAAMVSGSCPRPGRTVRGMESLRRDGKPAFTYNWLGLKRYTVAFRRACFREGDHPFEFVYDGKASAKAVRPRHVTVRRCRGAHRGYDASSFH